MKKNLIKATLVFFLMLSTSSVFAEDEISYEVYVDQIKLFLESNTDVDSMNEAVLILNKKPTRLSHGALKLKLENIREDKSFEILDQDSKVEVIKILNILISSHFTLMDKDVFELYYKWAVDSIGYESDMVEVLENMAQKIKIKLTSVPSTSRIFPDYYEDLFKLPGEDVKLLPAPKVNLQESAKNFLDRMKSEVMGQDEILDSLQSLYVKDFLIQSERRKPEIFYFMGLPGNGKDTIAEAYVNAIWEDENAYKDHMYRMDVRNKEEAWSLFGSGKGYVGSSELPDFLKFLVKHSGGKYIIKTEADGRDERAVVYKNPAANSSPTPPPSKAVVFVNEVHNMPKSVKDNILKQAVERGIFPITNPGSGDGAASYIELPVTFIFASNEGIELLEPREKNGTRLGAPLSYDHLIENYDRVKDDKQALKAAILKHNGEKNNSVGRDQPGTSEEFLNRIPNNRIFMLKPLSVDSLKFIVELQSKKMGQDLKNAKNQDYKFEVELTEEAKDFIVTFEQVASENARPLEGKIGAYIFDQLNKAITSGKIKADDVEDKKIKVDIKDYKNGAKSVVFEVTSGDQKYTFTRLVRESLKYVPSSPISDDRITEILSMRQKILDNVFGVEHIVDELIKAALVSESESKNSGESKRPATVMAFLGKSSTGKTETAKQFVRMRYGDEEKPNIIDFNGIQSVRQLEAKILGSVDDRNNPIASEFMKAYDRAKDGSIAFIFDEAANSPRELLKGLYEILREPVVRGFSDGKPRSMKNVTIILTGNAGEQIYQNIPKDLSKDVYERALHEVFRIFMRNKELQHKVLLENFSEAFLARLGQNVFHFGPLTTQSKRQITQLKLEQGLKKLKATASERGWNIKFKTDADLINLLNMIENEGFNHNYQGASIDRFVREKIIDALKSNLLQNGVKNNTDLVLSVPEEFKTVKNERDAYLEKEMLVATDDGREIKISVNVGAPNVKINSSDVDQILVAYHEVGHEIVSEVYYGDRVRPEYLSIIEGVTLIGDDFVHYAGLRASLINQSTQHTKDSILRRVAVLLGGYVAQKTVSLGDVDDAGKSNDIQRATDLIEMAVLKGGLSKRWYNSSAKRSDLSEGEKNLLKTIVNDWLAEAEQMAKEAILVNSLNLFPKMSKRLSEKGYLNADEIENLYKENGVITERDAVDFEDRANRISELSEKMEQLFEASKDSFTEEFNERTYNIERAQKAYDFLQMQNLGIIRRQFYKSDWDSLSDFDKQIIAIKMASFIKTKSRDAKLSSHYWIPEKVTRITDYILSERLEESSKVTDLEKFEIIERNSHQQPASGGGGLSCKAIL